METSQSKDHRYVDQSAAGSEKNCSSRANTVKRDIDYLGDDES